MSEEMMRATILAPMEWPGPGDRHPFIRLVQRRLTEAGYPVPETGCYDAATQAALAAFQQASELEARGTLDGRTVVVLWKRTA